MSDAQKETVVLTAAQLAEKIDPAILETSKLLVDSTTIDLEKETGVVSAETYEKILVAAGSSLEQATILHGVHQNLYPALAHAVGVMSVPAMADKADLKKIVVEMPLIGKDRVVVSFDRERTYADAGSNGTITKPGQVLVQHNVYGTKNRGEVAKVKNFLSQLALESLKGSDKK